MASIFCQIKNLCQRDDVICFITLLFPSAVTFDFITLHLSSNIMYHGYFIFVDCDVIYVCTYCIFFGSVMIFYELYLSCNML